MASISARSKGAVGRWSQSLSRCARTLPSVSHFSSQLVEKPVNLVIDPASTCSPFRGMKRVRLDDDNNIITAAAAVEEEEEEEDMVDETTTDSVKDESDSTTDDNDSIDDDDDDDNEYFFEDMHDVFGEQVWYDPSTKPLPATVIPLPDRLHVSVLDKTDMTTPVGTLTLHPVVFGQSHIRIDLIKRVVQYQRNKKRGKRFPARTKTISEISGSGRKLRPQKGQGMARIGHGRPPHFRGGNKAHGPKGVGQDYTTKLNRQTRRLGLVHVLSQKLKEGNVMVLNDLFLDTYRTNDLAKLLGGVGIGGKTGMSAFLLDWAESTNDDNDDSPEDDAKVHNHLPIHAVVASENIPKIKLKTQMSANVHDIVKHEKLILTVAAVEALEERLCDVTY